MFLFNFGNIQRHIIVAPHFTKCLLLVMMTIIMIIVMMMIIIIMIIKQTSARSNGIKVFTRSPGITWAPVLT